MSATVRKYRSSCWGENSTTAAKTAPAASENSRVSSTNTTTESAGTTKTGLWMSKPNGPTRPSMSSCPIE